MALIWEGLWSAPDAMAVEFEVADFLRSFAHLVKPRVVLETGCGDGYSTYAILDALQENENKGVLYTCDTSPEKVKALTKTRQLVATVEEGVSLACRVQGVEMAFLDSSGNRSAEAAALNLVPGGFLIIHDARRNYIIQGKLLAALKIPTPRGLYISQLLPYPY